MPRRSRSGRSSRTRRRPSGRVGAGRTTRTRRITPTLVRMTCSSGPRTRRCGFRWDWGGGYGECQDEESEEEDEEKVHKAKGVEDFITFEGAGNVNKTKVANVKAKDMKVGEGAPAPELSRRQREEIEARRKKENYDRMTAAGQTDEAKADLARLQEVRKRRAAAAAAKKEEAEREAAEAAAAEQAANAKAQVSASAKLELPPPGVGMKNALLKIKDIMDEDFQKKHNLKNASTNKLAKMKYKEFQKLFEAFDDAASEKQKAEFME
eukprot:TRINITY_DN492_c0_g2_i4.p1 TRINITY_DN492_c0_g2~~TRINITY_DN492_c0_g2_i4.p1  ORF type:complete len:266 (+),score=75.39 TRINITY_DN492_c0_g2_i4:181-978(+)